MTDLQREMEAFFAEYTARWNDQDNYSSLIDMWDTNDAPYYRPMERTKDSNHPDGRGVDVFTTWEELIDYWSPERKKQLIVALWYNFVNIRAKLVAPNIAVVAFDAEWDIKAIMGPAASGTDPGFAVLTRKPDGWKMNTYIEACTHPATYKSVFADKEDKVRPAFRKLIADICEANCYNCPRFKCREQSN